MRSLGLTLLALSLATNLLAQGTGTPPAKDPPPAAEPAMSEKNQKALDAFLAAWEARMTKMEGLETKIVLTETEEGRATVLTGDAALMKPNFAKMLLKDSENPSNVRKWRHIVANGENLWEYDYGKKIVRVLQLSKEGINDSTIMSFLFGMKAADIKKRYDMSVDIENPKKYNENYLHITILPRNKEDMQEFKKAELVLWVNRDKFADLLMLPARLWFQHPNGNQVSWEFKNMNPQKKFLKGDFKEPGFPDKEWKAEWAKPPVPTVSRTVAPPK